MRAALAAMALAVLGACTPARTEKSDVVTSARPEPTFVPSARASAAPAPAAATEEVPDAGGPHLVVVTARDDSEALAQIRTERLRAKAEGRVLVVYVSATWCEPCKRLKEEIRAGRLDAQLSRITLLAFDADRDIERLTAVGYAFKFVPFVALPGPDGRPTDMVEARGKGGGAWRELLGKLSAWQKIDSPVAR